MKPDRMETLLNAMNFVGLLIALSMIIYIMIVSYRREEKLESPDVQNIECCKPTGCCNATTNQKVIPHDP